MTNSIITTEDIQIVEDEPRIKDLILGKRLGLKRFRKIRDVIKENIEELLTYGRAPFVRADEKVGCTVRQTQAYFLNEAQTLLLCTLSRTPIAAAVRKEIIESYMSYRYNLLNQPTRTICPAYEEHAFVSTIKTAVRDELDAYFADTIRLQNDIKNSEAYLNGLLEGAFGNSRSMNKIREIAKCAMPRRS